VLHSVPWAFQVLHDVGGLFKCCMMWVGFSSAAWCGWAFQVLHGVGGLFKCCMMWGSSWTSIMWTQEHTCSTCCITLPFNGINLSLHPEKFRVKYENGEEEAQKAPDAYRMARKLLPEFFTPEELVTCSCVPPKPGKTERPRADTGKMDLLLGTSV